MAEIGVEKMLNHPDLLDVVDSVAQQAVSPVHCKSLKFNYCIAGNVDEEFILAIGKVLKAYIRTSTKMVHRCSFLILGDYVNQEYHLLMHSCKLSLSCLLRMCE